MKSKAAKYRKTMNTLAKVGGIAGKLALGAAIYSNPAIAGTVLANMGVREIAKLAEKSGDRYFKNKTGKAARLYKSSRDVVNAGLSYGSGDFAGAASNTAKLIGDTGFLSKNAQRKYNKTSSNYIQPTLRVAGAVQNVNRSYKVRAAKQKNM